MTPLVSVIMPTYNRAHLLPRAVTSVLDQDEGQMQLIIIDDGSEDETQTVIEGIGDARIEYVRLERNRGIGSARHAGISRVRGEFVAFIDSDDLWLPGKLALQLRLFEKYPQLDLIFGDFVNINHITGTSDRGFVQNQSGLDMVTKTALESGVWEITGGFPQGILTQNFISPPTVMFRARIIDTVGNFNPTLSGPEDLEFWWRAALHGVCFGYTEEALTERHKDDVSITAQAQRFIPRLLVALDICEQTAREHGREDLLEALGSARLRAWTGLIRAYALGGKRGQAVGALRQSLRYGVSMRGLLFALLALAGPRVTTWAKRVRTRMKPAGPQP